MTLPDEPSPDPTGLSWAAGARDGVAGHHGSGWAQARQVRQMAKLVLACTSRPSPRRLSRLHDGLTAGSPLDYLDPMIEEVVAANPDRDSVQEVGSWLMEQGTDRGPVKVGIALYGVAGFTDPTPVRDLGFHEEFTLYSAVALTNGFSESEGELWALATALNGWGRIHCVERLRDTSDPEIRKWILRHGFRNEIMYEYLAHIAATTGGLADALRRDDVDRELLTAAGEILEALLGGGPAEGILHYPDAGDAIDSYLVLMQTESSDVGGYLAVSNIDQFLSQEHGPGALDSIGLPESRREGLARRAGHLLADPAWESRIQTALQSDDDVLFHRAAEAARRAGIDTFDVMIERLEEDPLGRWWFQAWQQADEPRARTLADLALHQLDLGEIATGPTQDIGMGPGFEQHQALNWTLDGLRDHPGVGDDLVLAALQSPSTQNRWLALAALADWPRHTWPESTVLLLEDGVESEPDERVAEQIRDLLGDRDDRRQT